MKILDFGIMKAKQRVSQTESGTVKWKRRLHVTRAGAGPPVDHRSDLFSTGLVILYAATGEPTYPGDTFYDLLTAAASGLGDGQRARIAALPAPLPAILRRALEVDPAKRFQSSAEFSAAIAPHLSRGGATELAPGSQRCSATSCAPSKTAWPPPSRRRRGQRRSSCLSSRCRRQQARRRPLEVTGSETSPPGKC